MGSRREAGRDCDWLGGLGLAHARLGSVEFRVMIYRNQPRRLPSSSLLRAREARRHGSSRSRAMGSRREAGRDCDWLGGLGLAHARLGSVEFRVMIYRNQPRRLPSSSLLRAREARRHGSSRSRAMGSRREAGRDCDWLGGLGLAHARLGSVEFRVMIYRNQPPRLPSSSLLRAREARRHGSSRSRAMGSRREAGRDCDWLGGLGLAHARLGSVEF